MESLFEKLGIYGLPNSSEDAIMACLFQGEPGLLIGPPGTAKTELLECIGNAIRESDKQDMPNEPEKWFTTQVYDTSKLNPEDLVGFPNPKAIMDGKMDYIKLPSTIWDKHMVVWDEINRCEKSRQSNLFEIIRSRRVNGIPTNNKFIFSAMNMLGDTGTQEMSDALTDRHIFYIHFQKFENLGEEHKMRIISRVGSHESVGVRHWTGRKFELDTEDGEVNERIAEVGRDIKAIMKEAAPIYDNLQKEIGDNVSKLIIRISSAIAEEKNKKDSKVPQLDISGRRANMMLRGILSIRAIQLAKAKVLNSSFPGLESTLTNASTMAIPIGIGQKATVDVIQRLFTLVQEVVKVQYATLFNNSPDADKIYAIFYDKNPISRLNSMMELTTISKLTEHKLWSELYDMCKDSELEAILGILNSTYKILPANIEINQAVVAKEKAKKEVAITGPYAEHKPFMQMVLDRARGNKVLEFAVGRSLSYLSRIGSKHTLGEVVSNLSNIDKLAASLKKKIEKLDVNKSSQQTTTVNTTDTELSSPAS